jgi:hypothetical protein
VLCLIASVVRNVTAASMALAKSQKSLKSWGKEDWGTKSGKPSGKTGERYLPKKARESLSSSEYAATTKAKRKGTAAGKQFVKQPKEIAKKTSKFRAAEGGLTMKKGMHKMPDGSMMKDKDHKSSYMSGGMTKKPMRSGYGHGGVVKANCGASMEATQGKKT